jgi:hypothetical protein
VIVYGTLKNLLGPHHNGPLRGSAWPASFEAAPPAPPAGANYDVIAYGLFDPFLLIEAEGGAQKVYYRYYQVSRPEILADAYLGVDAPLKISMMTGTPEADIYYTLDGTSPDRNALLYRTPISLSKSAVLKARAYKKELKESPLVQKSFYIVDSKINGLNYAYYEGQWDDLPPFDKLEAAGEGRVSDFDLNLLKTRQEKFAVRYSGFIYLDKAGSYDFYVNSNDGSKLFIGDQEVVDNGGSHGPQERQGKIKLQAGIHPLTVHYFDSGGGQLLEVTYRGPGIEKQPIPADILRYKK